MDTDLTPSQIVTTHINDSKKDTNDKICLILGVIMACHGQENHEELTKIKNIINVSTMANKDKIIGHINMLLST
tara:strand:- start:240 stop:461 length:222 start_codon:yes stop_codon:yes gene_type:complete